MKKILLYSNNNNNNNNNDTKIKTKLSFNNDAK